MILRKLMIFTHIDKVRDFASIQPGFRVHDRAFLYPGARGTHEF
jgi:hypothetical protein